jgi:uncharacterized glyoxalase superfamily protein PhnB
MASEPYPSLTSSVSYRDPKRMLRWLEDAFGFEPAMAISDGEGNLVHSEMAFGNGRIMVGPEWSADHKSPVSVGGKNTQTVHVHLERGVDAHCERARQVGAEILMEPETQFYGDRTYRARDPEGHIWTFGETVEVVTPEQWDKKMGLTTTTRLPE